VSAASLRGGLTQALGLMKKYWRYLAGVSIGAAITPFAVAGAIASAGAGHGNYFLAKLLFPYSMLLTRATGDSITTPLIALAVVQFPVYGLAAASFNTKRFSSYLFALHVIFACLCFSGLLPKFA
jgi:hypothetical protein